MELNYESFIENLEARVNSMSDDECIDTVICACTTDFYCYRCYIDENGCDEDKFDICEKIFMTILRNRYTPHKTDIQSNIDSCNEFLEKLQEEEADYFDECVNVTCQIMHILAYLNTRDRRNITAALKLHFETAEAYIQREYPESCDEKTAAAADSILKLDISSLTSLYTKIRE